MAGRRDQLWAEALERYRNGLRANLPAGLFADAGAAADANRAADVLEDLILDRAAGLEGLTLGSIAEQCNMGAAASLGRSEQMRLARALQSCGFTKLRRRTADGQRESVWTQEGGG